MSRGHLLWIRRPMPNVRSKITTSASSRSSRSKKIAKLAVSVASCSAKATRLATFDDDGANSPAGHDLSGTLRIGFTEDSCGRGVVPESFRRFRELQPEAETPALAVGGHGTDRGN